METDLTLWAFWSRCGGLEHNSATNPGTSSHSASKIRRRLAGDRTSAVAGAVVEMGFDVESVLERPHGSGQRWRRRPAGLDQAQFKL
jgi:hypothetical protein